MKTTPSPEPLESRISPAAFFASATNLNVRNAGNTIITGDAAAATFAGVDFALLLGEGDRLYLDGDDNVTTTGDQTLLVHVTNSLGMVFLDDDGGGTFSDALAGLAVADEFSGVVADDIGGDVVTALTSTGALARTATEILIQKADIAGLRLTGGSDVNGSILSGGKISSIVGGPGSVVTGIITNSPGHYSLGSGIGGVPASAYIAPTLAAGAPGANINGVILDHVSEIRAAAGLPKTGAAGGAGGSISNVFLGFSVGTNVIAGDGAVGAGTGKGGAGGSVKHVSAAVSGALVVTAGAGGGRADIPGTGGGGNGGLLSNINVTNSSESAAAILSAGAGGNAFSIGGVGSTGGKGGSVLNSAIDFTGFGSVFVSAGSGGFGGTSHGGAGGDIKGTSIVMNGGSLATNIGNGGSSENGRGGAGGSYVDDTVLIRGEVFQSGAGLFVAGSGGGGTAGGGAGGIVSKSSLRILGFGSSLSSFSAPDLLIAGGSGGELFAGASAAIKPGKGGMVRDFDLTLGPGASLPGGIVVGGGEAGSATGLASGAVGGAVTKLTIDVSGTLGTGEIFMAAPPEEGVIIFPPMGAFAHIVVLGGSGSDAGTGGGSNGIGGNGGAVTGVNIIHHGSFGFDALGSVNVISGSGGDGSGAGRGGAGGALGSGGAPINIRAQADLLNGVYLGTGHGGDGSLGGVGGTLNTANVFIGNAGGGFSENAVAVFAGDAGSSAVAKGAVGGSVMNLSVVATGELIGFVDVFAGYGGDAPAPQKGGNGGNIQKSNITTYGSSGEVLMYAGDGGVGATGGRGGALNGSSFTFYGPVSGAFAGSGDGGGGIVGTSTGGVGGNVSGFAVRDFGANLIEIDAGYGGSVFSGTGGVGGTVSGTKLDAAYSNVVLYGGNGGTSTEGAGGAGGKVVAVTGVVGTFSAYGGDGADGSTTGGAGGNVQSVNIMATNRAHILRAGDGGAGGAGGGVGGKITTTTVIGDIGDFGTPGGTGLGLSGLIAGLGGVGATAGANGSISGISASRISTIMAGDTGSGIPTAANAVLKISGVKAAVIGADFDSDGVFDFIDNGGTASFNIGIDEPIDGFVLAKTSGITPASFGGTPPLLLITVA